MEVRSEHRSDHAGTRAQVVQGTQEALQETLRGARVKVRGFFLSFMVLGVLQGPSVQASGRIDKAATLAARSCQAVTREALSGVNLEELVSDGSLAAEVWIAGEFVPDIRITLWGAEGEVKVEVVQTPSGAGRVCEQLREAYRSNPDLNTEEAAERIKTTIKTHTGATHPELKHLLEALRDLHFSSDLNSSIFFPNRSIILRVANGYEELSVRFNQPEPTADGVAYSGSLAISQLEVSQWVDKLTHTLGLP